MKSFLKHFETRDNEPQITIAGPLANAVSSALEEVYSTEFKLVEEEVPETSEVETEKLAGESQQTNAIDNGLLLKELEREDLEKATGKENGGNTTIYSIAKSQLNSNTVMELTKRINNASGSCYMRDINGYYSDLHLVLVDDYGMPSWFSSAVGTVDINDRAAGFALSIENFAKSANVPLYNTFGEAIKAIANKKDAY